MAKEKCTITAGGVAMTDIYQTTRNKEKTQAELATSAKALIENDIDMIICEVIFVHKFRENKSLTSNIFTVLS